MRECEGGEKFSVLISVYFNETPIFLKKALDSILNQTLKPGEVVLVKDGIITKELEDVISAEKNKFNKNNIDFVLFIFYSIKIFLILWLLAQILHFLSYIF